MDFEKKLGRISRREWPAVRGAWLGSLPSIDRPGAAPEHGVSQLEVLRGPLSRTPETGEYREQVAGVREAVLREGVFLLHKAAHVVGCGQLTANIGMPSWSLSTAYQGAYFAKQGLLAMLGITIAEAENKSTLIDIWPEIRDGASTRERRAYQLGTEIQFVRLPRPDHYHRWAVLQRALRVLQQSPFPDATRIALDRPDYRDFAKQRNTLHYSNTWLFDDLVTFLVLPGFGRPVDRDALVGVLTEHGDDFSIVLAQVLLAFGARLLQDLAERAPALQPEYELLKDCLVSPERHPGFAEVSVLAL